MEDISTKDLITKLKNSQYEAGIFGPLRIEELLSLTIAHLEKILADTPAELTYEEENALYDRACDMKCLDHGPICGDMVKHVRHVYGLCKTCPPGSEYIYSHKKSSDSPGSLNAIDNEAYIPSSCRVCSAPMRWVESGPIPGRATPLRSHVCSEDPTHSYPTLPHEKT